MSKPKKKKKKSLGWTDEEIQKRTGKEIDLRPIKKKKQRIVLASASSGSSKGGTSAIGDNTGGMVMGHAFDYPIHVGARDWGDDDYESGAAVYKEHLYPKSKP